MIDALDELVLLGDPRLYKICEPIQRKELPLVDDWVAKLDSVMQAIKSRYGFGRGIAAPQVGIMKRLFYIHIDRPIVVINPEIVDASEEYFELWDDCMSFPNLLVRVKRHKSIRMRYLDREWQEQEWNAHDAMSELLQHEYDHLNGILCTMRAIDNKSFKWKRS